MLCINTSSSWDILFLLSLLRYHMLYYGFFLFFIFHDK